MSKRYNDDYYDFNNHNKDSKLNDNENIDLISDFVKGKNIKKHKEVYNNKEVEDKKDEPKQGFFQRLFGTGKDTNENKIVVHPAKEQINSKEDDNINPFNELIKRLNDKYYNEDIHFDLSLNDGIIDILHTDKSKDGDNHFIFEVYNIAVATLGREYEEKIAIRYSEEFVAKIEVIKKEKEKLEQEALKELEFDLQDKYPNVFFNIRKDLKSIIIQHSNKGWDNTDKESIEDVNRLKNFIKSKLEIDAEIKKQIIFIYDEELEEIKKAEILNKIRNNTKTITNDNIDTKEDIEISKEDEFINFNTEDLKKDEVKDPIVEEVDEDIKVDSGNFEDKLQDLRSISDLTTINNLIKKFNNIDLDKNPFQSLYLEAIKNRELEIKNINREKELQKIKELNRQREIQRQKEEELKKQLEEERLRIQKEKEEEERREQERLAKIEEERKEKERLERIKQEEIKRKLEEERQAELERQRILEEEEKERLRILKEEEIRKRKALEEERLEQERILKEEEEQRAKEEAERLAKLEEERKAKEEAKRLAKQEEEQRKALEEAKRLAKEEAERKAKEEEAERKRLAEEERLNKIKEELRLKEEAAKKEEERLKQEEQEQKALEEEKILKENKENLEKEEDDLLEDEEDEKDKIEEDDTNKIDDNNFIDPEDEEEVKIQKQLDELRSKQEKYTVDSLFDDVVEVEEVGFIDKIKNIFTKKAEESTINEEEIKEVNTLNEDDTKTDKPIKISKVFDEVDEVDEVDKANDNKTIKDSTTIIEDINIDNIEDTEDTENTEEDLDVEVLDGKENKLPINTRTGLIVLSVLVLVFSIFKITNNPKKEVVKSYNKTFIESNTLHDISHINFMGSNSMKGINGLNLRIDRKKDDTNKEAYKNIELISDNKKYNWERFNRHNLLIMKSAFDPQYLTVDDIESFGFEKINTNNLTAKTVFNFLNEELRSKDIKKEKDLSTDIQGIKGYLQYYLRPSKVVSYSYNIDLDSSKSKILVDKIFKDFIKENQQFIKEEVEVEKRLKHDDFIIEDFEDLTYLLYENLEISKTNIKLNINKNGNIDFINVKFIGVMHDEEVEMTLDVLVKEVDKEIELDKEEFYVNNIELEKLTPRIVKEEYKEIMNDEEVKEGTGTFEDLEKIDEESITFDINEPKDSKEDKKEEKILPQEIIRERQKKEEEEKKKEKDDSGIKVYN